MKMHRSGTTFLRCPSESPQSQIMNAERPNAKSNRLNVFGKHTNRQTHKCTMANVDVEHTVTKIKLAHMKVPKHNQNEAQKITIANACIRFKLSANTSDTVTKNCVIRLNSNWRLKHTSNMHTDNTALYNRHLESEERTKHAQTCTRHQLYRDQAQPGSVCPS